MAIPQPLLSPALSLNLDGSKLITSRSRSSFSSSFFFLPPEKRLAIQRVYAFFRVIDDVVDEEADPFKQRALLDSWKKELIQAYSQESSVPLLQELMQSIRRFSIPQDYFLELISGCEMDITKKRYQNFDELYEYCYRVASIVGLVCMKIFEYESPTSQESAIHLGLALQLTNIIRDVGVDLQKNRIYLPEEDLQKFKVTETDLHKGEVNQAIIQLLNFQYDRAQTYYERGFSEFKKDSAKKLLAARMMGVVYRSLLEKIKRKNFPVLHKRVRLNPLEKSSILIRVLVGHYL